MRQAYLRLTLLVQTKKNFTLITKNTKLPCTRILMKFNLYYSYTEYHLNKHEFVLGTQIGLM